MVSSVEEQIINLALSQGIFAVLFIFLLFYVLKSNMDRENRMLQKSEDREDKLINIINGLRNEFKVVKDIEKGIDEIKDKLSDRR